MNLLLLNKDVPVLTFEYDADRHDVVEINESLNPQFAPPAILDLKGMPTDKSLRYWWSHRGIPASRDQLDHLIRVLGIESRIVMLEHSMGLSLTDRYWVKPVDSDLTWAEVNFFDNDFSGHLGDLTLTPAGSPRLRTDIDLMDPNSSVGGNVPKKWCIGPDGRRWLIKTGNKVSRQDVFNEVIATELHSMALTPDEFVRYSLVIEGDGPYCACPNFLGENEEYVPACDLLVRHSNSPLYGSYGWVISTLCESGLERQYIESCMAKVFSLDYLMANSDRHTGNFGLIRDCSTLEYKRFAPIFDTGFSLWCDAYRLSNPSDYDYTPRPFLGRVAESPERQLRLFDDYRWLPDLDLKQWRCRAIEILSENENLPLKRIEAIGKGIDMQIAKLQRHVERMATLFPNKAPSHISTSGTSRQVKSDPLPQTRIATPRRHRP